MMYVLDYLIYHLRPYGIASYIRPADRMLAERFQKINNNPNHILPQQPKQLASMTPKVLEDLSPTSVTSSSEQVQNSNNNVMF